MQPALSKRLGAELLGTFWLVFGGCGSAIFAAKFYAPGGVADAQGTELGIGLLGVALAFGLTVVTMAYAVGHVSGGHFNPAVTIGLWAARASTTSATSLPISLHRSSVACWPARACGAWPRAPRVPKHGRPMAANGYGEHSPGGYSMWAVFLAEALLTAFFLFVILGVTTKHAPTGFAPLAIGLTLTLIHLISIPISNTSVNPARSTAVAFFNGAGAPGQLWLFWVAPIVGALIAGWSATRPSPASTPAPRTCRADLAETPAK
jgi:aquaporin Z